MGRMYAYSRITPGDCEEEIRSVMKEMQVADEDIYADHVTKKHRTLPEYAKLLKKLEGGDLLYISGLSSLGDSYAEGTVADSHQGEACGCDRAGYAFRGHAERKGPVWSPGSGPGLLPAGLYNGKRQQCPQKPPAGRNHRG